MSWNASVIIDRIQRGAASLNAAVKEMSTELLKGVGTGLLICVGAIFFAVLLLEERREARARRRDERRAFVDLWNLTGREGRWRVSL